MSAARSGRFVVTRAAAILALLLMAPSPTAFAWDEQGHAIITELALEALPDTMPAWVRSPEVRARLIYLSAEPDRWRGQRHVQVDHINNPDHYLDVEHLAPYRLTLETLPPLRRQFTDRLAEYRALHPEEFKDSDPAKDAAYTRSVPGLLPYRIAELQWLTAASWTQYKTYEQYRDRVTDNELRQARENIIFHMGIISHFVGDATQPLHLTEHYNGWVGPNPKGYTTKKNFHALIDGGLIEQFGITADRLRRQARPPIKVSVSDDHWPELCAWLAKSHTQVEPLYALEKSGELYQPAGRRFIEDRLLEAGAMLAGVWAASHDAAVIDEYREKQLKARKMPATTQPAEQPTTQPVRRAASAAP